MQPFHDENIAAHAKQVNKFDAEVYDLHVFLRINAQYGLLEDTYTRD